MKRIAIGIVLAVLASACGAATNPVAASVGGLDIAFEEVEAGLDGFRATEQYEQLAAQGDIAAIERDFQQGFLAQLIRRAVLAPEAKALGIVITDADVSEQIDVIMADFPSESAFEEALKEQGTSVADLQSNVRDRLTEDAVRAEVTAAVKPGASEIEQFYNDNIARFQQAQVSHILVPGRTKAKRLSEQLRAAPEDQVEELFARLARGNSTDQGSAPAGGDLGVTQPDAFVAEFADAVRSLEVGVVSEPVQTQFGFHIIRVASRSTASLDEVAAAIEREIAGPQEEEVFKEWLIAAYEVVRVSTRFGTVDPVTGVITDPNADTIPGGEAPEVDDSELEEPGPLDAPQPAG